MGQGEASSGQLGEDLPQSSTLTELVHTYVRFRRDQGTVNDRSAEQLRYRLWDFAQHAPDDPGKVRRRHVEKWMARPDLSPSYLRGRLSTLRGFSQWCVLHRHMRTDPTLEIPLPHVDDLPPKRMTHAEAVSLADAAAGDDRTALIVSLMLQEALRRIEIAHADLDDVDWAEQTLGVRGKGGRGKVTRIVPLSDETWRLLAAYRASEGSPARGPLIRSRVRKGARMSEGHIAELVRQAMIDCGVKQPGDSTRTPHSCRHTAAHEMIAHGADIREVQKGLGHKSIRTTEQVYLRGEVTDLRSAMGGRSYRAG